MAICSTAEAVQVNFSERNKQVNLVMLVQACGGCLTWTSSSFPEEAEVLAVLVICWGGHCYPNPHQMKQAA